MKAQLRAAGGGNPDINPDPDNSDCEGPTRRPPVNRRSTAPSGSHVSRQATPAGTGITSTATTSKSNNKYPDVKDFHRNEEDRHTWDSWKMHLNSKFMMSWELFETETSKILYIRDHCKETAYDIIKGRANLNNLDHYLLAEEVIFDLKQTFSDFDKEGKADAEL